MSSELFLSRFAGRTWAAVREAGRTTELLVETERSVRATVGRIVLARVTRVLPGMQVAFVDVGLERDGFLHVSDLVLPGERAAPSPGPGRDGAADDDVDRFDGEPSDPAGPAGPHRAAPIQDRLREGRDLLVQITREPIRAKGARVSAYLTFAGRFLVYLPQASLRGVSRRIRDEDERTRLRGLVEGIGLPGGFILRTAGEGLDEDAVLADARRLVAVWDHVRRRAEHVAAPAVVHDDGDLLSRLLRDAPVHGYGRIVVDDTDLRDRVTALQIEGDPIRGEVRAGRVELHEGDRSLFETHAVDQEVERALSARVWLRSGGYIVIEPTEALVSIDVNTGKYVGRDRPEETVLRTNVEAAIEIARQLRLRDLGGIIVVDFIDMESEASRRQVQQALQEALADDRARTKIVGISELGLVQMTRKRTRPGLAETLTRPCPACDGRGRVKAVETVAWEALREVHRHLPTLRPERVSLRARADVLRAFETLWHRQPPPDGVDLARVDLLEDGSLEPESFDVVLG